MKNPFHLKRVKGTKMCWCQQKHDSIRVQAIYTHLYATLYFPEVADRRVWFAKCVSAINERLRRPARN